MAVGALLEYSLSIVTGLVLAWFTIWREHRRDPDWRDKPPPAIWRSVLYVAISAAAAMFIWRVFHLTNAWLAVFVTYPAAWSLVNRFSHWRSKGQQQASRV